MTGGGAPGGVLGDDGSGGAEEVLAAAAALVDAGEDHAAIDLLEAADRTRADDRIERRLVDLRHEACGRLRPTPRADWPPEGDDPGPGPWGPPECAVADLTPALLAGALAHRGSLLVRGLLDATQTRRMATAVNRTLLARERHRKGRTDPAVERWYRPFPLGEDRTRFGKARFVRAIDSPRGLHELLDAYRQVGVLDVITEHLGERPLASASKCVFRRSPPGMVGKDLHQDGSFLGADIRTVNVWTALTACGGPDSRAPALDLVARRIDHVVATGGSRTAFDWSVPDAAARALAGPEGIVRPRFEPGDALLFDQLLLHRTAMSRGMTEEREAIESWFFAPSAYPGDHVPFAV